MAGCCLLAKKVGREEEEEEPKKVETLCSPGHKPVTTGDEVYHQDESQHEHVDAKHLPRLKVRARDLVVLSDRGTTERQGSIQP